MSDGSKKRLNKKRAIRKDMQEEAVNKTFIHPKLKLMTKMNNGKKNVLITYKEMTVSVTETDSEGNQKEIEKHKYSLGDVGLQKYSRRIREYMLKGFEVSGTVSNMDEVIKEYKKSGTDKDGKT